MNLMRDQSRSDSWYYPQHSADWYQTHYSNRVHTQSFQKGIDDHSRILQEALTNAVRHGIPEKISVTGECNHNRIAIKVINQGGRKLKATGGGHGIHNMKRRAQNLPEGALEITPLEDGAELTLSFTHTTSINH